MSESFVCALPSLVIPSGATNSNGVSGIDDSQVISIFGPSALTGRVRLQVELSPTGTSWCDLTTGGATITVGAGLAVLVTKVAFRQVRLHSSSAEGAQRTFRFAKCWE